MVQAYYEYYRYISGLTQAHGVPPVLLTRNDRAAALALQRLVADNIVNDCQAMAMYADESALAVEAGRLGPNAGFNFMLSMAVFVNREDRGVVNAARGGVTIFSSANPVYLQASHRLSGYQSQYRDDSISRDNPYRNADQGHHLSAYMSLGFQASGMVGGTAIANAIAWARDLPNPGDRNLGYAAISIGADLRNGKIGIRDVAHRIRELCN